MRPRSNVGALAHSKCTHAHPGAAGHIPCAATAAPHARPTAASAPPSEVTATAIRGSRERGAGPHSSPSAAGNSSNPTSAYGTLRQARRAACPAAAGRVDGRTRRRPAMRRGPARILTCFRGRVLARHITSPCLGGATGGKVCRTSLCQCLRRLEECDGSPHCLHVLWLARSCSMLLTQPRCRSGTAPGSPGTATLLSIAF